MQLNSLHTNLMLGLHFKSFQGKAWLRHLARSGSVTRVSTEPEPSDHPGPRGGARAGGPDGSEEGVQDKVVLKWPITLASASAGGFKTE
jgi:hypothetical protein